MTLTLIDAAEIREEAGLPTSVRLEGVAAVVERSGDRELGLTALTMIPRPEWVSELLGLHPEREVGK